MNNFCSADSFEVDGSGIGCHRVYGTAERPIDVLAEVRSGDAVLVPHGWHGPSMAAPGEDRTWATCDDPAHAWVRDSWASQPTDPRVPLTSATGRSAS